MSGFEYAMVLVSIIIGLGVTHILSSLGSAVHRLRGHGKPLRLELNYLIWIAFIFGWMVQFWWWEFKWTTLGTDVDFRLYSFLVLYAVSLFMIAVILVPHHLTVVEDSWTYFLSIRLWFFGGLLGLNVLDVVDTFMKGWEWGLRQSYTWYALAVTACGIIGLLTTRRRVHIAMGLVLVAWSNGLTFYEQFVLGRW
jgi:multisubunit Na+/H+ antiporter MnhC subunit